MTRKLAFLWLGMVLFLRGMLLRFDPRALAAPLGDNVAAAADVANIVMMSAALMMILSFTRLTDAPR